MTSPPSPLRRPMDMGQIINTAIGLYRLNFGEFLAMAAVTLPVSVVVAIISGVIGNAVASVSVTAVLVIPSAIIGLIAQTAIARAVADVGDGNAPHFEATYGRVLPRVGTLLVTALRIFVVVLALFVTIIGIPLGIYFAVRWAFFPQLVAIESDAALLEASLKWVPSEQRQSRIAALLASFEHRISNRVMRCSTQIVAGSWWRTLGILIMVAILASFPTAAVSLIFAAASPIAANLASAVVGVIVFPFSAAAMTLLFFDLQSRERERVSIA